MNMVVNQIKSGPAGARFVAGRGLTRLGRPGPEPGRPTAPQRRCPVRTDAAVSAPW